MSDHNLRELCDEIIGELATLLVQAGRSIDFVTLNLGYSVLTIAAIADKVREKSNQPGNAFAS